MKTIRTTTTALFAVALMTLASCGSETADKTAKKADATNDTAKSTKPMPAKTYSVVPTEGKVMWKGTLLGVYSHEGTVDIKKGILTMRDGKIEDGEFYVDMSTITPTDDNYSPKEGKSKDALVGHLSSPDFFDVANHPYTNVKLKGESALLTIRGNEGEVKFDNLNIEEQGGSIHATGTMTIDRKAFGVSYEGAGDAVLSDDIEIEVDVMLKES